MKSQINAKSRQVGGGVRVGAAAPGVLALIRADVMGRHNIHTELNLPDVLPTVLTKVEVRAERPMILDRAICSLFVVETSANLGARVDDVNEKYTVLDDLVLDIVGDGVSCVVSPDLCAVARGNVTSVENAVGKWRGEEDKQRVSVEGDKRRRTYHREEVLMVKGVVSDIV